MACENPLFITVGRSRFGHDAALVEERHIFSQPWPAAVDFLIGASGQRRLQESVSCYVSVKNSALIDS
jgi:hypothetical protein